MLPVTQKVIEKADMESRQEASGAPVKLGTKQ
jgi:hypothetical protein